MGHVYRETYTKPLPANAELFRKKGEQFARVKPKKGRAQTFPITTGKDGSLRIVRTAGTYTARYRDGQDILQKVTTGCRDEDAARSVLKELERRAELVRAGVLSATENAIADKQATLINEHVEAYLTHLSGHSSSADHQRLVRGCLGRLVRECGFRRLSDLDAERLEKWLREAERAGLGARTRNRYRSAVIAFCNWCVNTSRLAGNPFARVAAANEKADRRHVRRALSEQDIVAFLKAAEERPLAEARTIRRGRNAGQRAAQVKPHVEERLRELGRERRLVYLVLLSTGLRKSELAALKASDFRLDESAPFIELPAKHEKNREGAFIPLRADVADELRQFAADRYSDVVTFPGVEHPQPNANEKLLRVPDGLHKILTRDLEFAGISKHDDRGRVVDVHALRTTFGTMLSKAGVPPRTAQAAMRHSDISLTMQIYTDPRLLDVENAMSALPLPITNGKSGGQSEAG